jgi:hypothetical protein
MVAFYLVPLCPPFSLTSIAAFQGLVASALGNQGGFVPVGEFVK